MKIYETFMFGKYVTICSNFDVFSRVDIVMLQNVFKI